DEEADWLAVDCYAIDRAYRHVIRDAGMRILWLSDFATDNACHADVILNGNPDATAAAYPQRDRDAHSLLGARYLPLRAEFGRPAIGWVESDARRVRVAMGGADPQNATALLCQAIHDGAATRSIQVIAVAGPLREGIETKVPPTASDTKRVQWLHDVRDMH